MLEISKSRWKCLFLAILITFMPIESKGQESHKNIINVSQKSESEQKTNTSFIQFPFIIEQPTILKDIRVIEKVNKNNLDIFSQNSFQWDISKPPIYLIDIDMNSEGKVLTLSPIRPASSIAREQYERLVIEKEKEDPHFEKRLLLSQKIHSQIISQIEPETFSVIANPQQGEESYILEEKGEFDSLSGIVKPSKSPYISIVLGPDNSTIQNNTKIKNKAYSIEYLVSSDKINWINNKINFGKVNTINCNIHPYVKLVTHSPGSRNEVIYRIKCQARYRVGWDSTKARWSLSFISSGK